MQGGSNETQDCRVENKHVALNTLGVDHSVPQLLESKPAASTQNPFYTP